MSKATGMHSSAGKRPLRARMRRRAGSVIVDGAFRGLSAMGRAHPKARPARHDLERLRDIPYLPTGLAAHHLDVWRPRRAPWPRPVLLYIHGGGFRILSKDTHWVMALAFARQGFVVFNINYRLAPQHPFPAAIEDAAAALQWVQRNAGRFGGDISQLVIAGESAGANLTLALAACASIERPEPPARAIFDSGVEIRAIVPACGLLQASDVARFYRERNMPQWLQDRMDEVSEAYLQEATPYAEGGLSLADPLNLVEAAAAGDLALKRPLPPAIATVGRKDPVLDDTRRLAAALERLGVEHQARYYANEPHAFQAFVFRPNARQAWADTFSFLERHVDLRAG